MGSSAWSSFYRYGSGLLQHAGRKFECGSEPRLREHAYISDSIGLVVIPIHHFGKDAGTGLRGASAWRGAADVVISVTGDIDPLKRRTHNRALAIAKARDAEQGPIAPFRLDYVKLGIDKDGEEFGSCVVLEDPERPKNVPRNQVPKWVPIFDTACKRALSEHGQELIVDSGKVRAVELRHVRANFCGTYVTGDEVLKRAKQTSEKAWQTGSGKNAEPITVLRYRKGW